VRRVFEQYAGSASTKRIAEQLNAEGVRAPYDGDYTKPAGRGWEHTRSARCSGTNGASDDSSGTVGSGPLGTHREARAPPSAARGAHRAAAARARDRLRAAVGSRAGAGLEEEGKLSRSIFAALHELLASHDFRHRFADRFARRLAARKPADAEERSRLEADVRAQEADSGP
jgi:hypothetical protein